MAFVPSTTKQPGEHWASCCDTLCKQVIVCSVLWMTRFPEDTIFLESTVVILLTSEFRFGNCVFVTLGM